MHSHFFPLVPAFPHVLYSCSSQVAQQLFKEELDMAKIAYKQTADVTRQEGVRIIMGVWCGCQVFFCFLHDPLKSWSQHLLAPSQWCSKLIQWPLPSSSHPFIARWPRYEWLWRGHLNLRRGATDAQVEPLHRSSWPQLPPTPSNPGIYSNCAHNLSKDHKLQHTDDT